MTFPRTRAEGPEDLFAVVAEWADQGPILMETEGGDSSYAAAEERLHKIRAQRGLLRACIVRLVYERGNALVLHDMRRMHVEVKE